MSVRTLRAVCAVSYQPDVYLYADDHDEWYLCEAAPRDMREGRICPPPTLTHVGFSERQSGVALWNGHRITLFFKR